jgi:hypothetical protein
MSYISRGDRLCVQMTSRWLTMHDFFYLRNNNSPNKHITTYIVMGWTSWHDPAHIESERFFNWWSSRRHGQQINNTVVVQTSQNSNWLKSLSQPCPELGAGARPLWLARVDVLVSVWWWYRQTSQQVIVWWWFRWWFELASCFSSHHLQCLQFCFQNLRRYCRWMSFSVGGLLIISLV